MSPPRLLDLFCGAGGAGVGYARAGFEVVGVDLAPQPRYPFGFVQEDAMDVLNSLRFNPLVGSFDAVHASPPCQPDSMMSVCRPGLASTYERLIGPVRELLVASGLPYVIENVVRAELVNPTMLCGQMFGLDLFRHRLFETSFPMPLVMHPPHGKLGSQAGRWKPGRVISVAGNCSPIAEAKRAMGIDWMNRSELAEAIPPAFTEFIGGHLVDHLAEEAA